MVLQPIAAVYQYILAPTSTLDLLATVRLCLALRQIRERRASGKKLEDTIAAVENRSFVRDALTTLVVVYGGEAMISALHWQVHISLCPASFMLSGATPLLCVVTQALVESIPAFMIPIPSFNTELPFSIFDAYNRAFLLCSIVPPVVLSSPAAGASGSPWALVLSSLVLANGGFFLANLFSLLQPTPLAVSTPPELLPYGWTATDLWSAPLVAALYATLTHTQPFWADVHAVLVGLVGGAVDAEGLAKVEPLDTRNGESRMCVGPNGINGTLSLSCTRITEKIKTN
ncbi:hypothetical protein BKA82DRAFT_4229825 [Pisolithus tinctorius]|nr:hypothetical protein BKA82DRAFT_4229825 [Pisolithus tinctorius]